jgi:UDP-N-acetylmuramoyl-L-alanyl-D-glutamate--2,6-diaminopimelate ligase
MAPRRLDSLDAALAWLRERGVTGLATDSRRVRAGDAFVAWPGYAVDGRQYVAQALAAGARACLVEAQGVESYGFRDDAIATLADLKSRTGDLAAAFYGVPSERLEVVATTGTNGKTSTAWWTAQALTLLGRRCGLVGTLGIGEPPVAGRAGGVLSTGLTTPDPVALQVGLRRFVDDGFAACAVEASSIGIVEHRLAGTHIGVALFTNLTLDHLDYHETMAAYADAKAALFDWPGLRAVVLNLDDDFGAAQAARLRGGALDLWTYAADRDACDARLCAEGVHYRDGGLVFTLREGGDAVEIRSGLIGTYNVSNLLAVIGGLRALGHGLREIAAVVPALTAVPGRMQRVPATRPGPEVVVDYAHSPDALEKVLHALRPFATERGGALWCVFGCGGNRDAGKRPKMGAIAQRLADRIVITSDNPRHEAAEAIVAQVAAGLAPREDARVALVVDRRTAIADAVRRADAKDVLLVAGKGHEDYQEIAGVRHPFSDLVEAQAALEARA